MSAILHKWQGKADYKDMRCLYCGKELALLKRLTGSEFCSDAHKQSYQDEYNRLALSRLLQAQSKSEEIKSKAGQAVPAAKQSEPETEAAAEAAPQPELKAPSEFQWEPERKPTPEPPAIETEPELVATETAGFFSDPKPPVREMVFAAKSMVGVALDWPPNPSIPSVPFTATARNEGPAPAMANLIPLDLRPPAPRLDHNETTAGSPDPQAAHREFSGGRLNMEIPLRPVSSTGLPLADPVPLTIAARVPATLAPEPNEGPLEFGFELGVRESARLDFALTSIELPPEDADVMPSSDSDSETAETTGTPRGALEALAKLHKAIKEENAREGWKEKEDALGDQIPADPVIDSTELGRIFGRPGIPAQAARQEKALPDNGGSVAVAVSELEIAPSEMELAGVARAADQLIAMPVKLAVPAKASLAAGFPALAPKPEPQIPRSDALPLRPKVAINPAGVVPKTEEPKTNRAAAPPKAEPAPPASETKTAAPEPLKAVRSVSIPTPPPAPPAKPAAPKKESPRKEAANPAVEAPTKPPDPKPAPAAERPMEIDAPHLLLTSASAGSFGALSGKMKIVAAIAAIVIVAVLGYLAFGGSKNSGRAASADAIATSIMMGEGGWVTNWAGDSTGLHRGRQITIYRPSLKLSDCRIEFQGRIINNSIGWVFRAVDAGNYYAMKVTQSSGYKLQKYAVINGQEHYLGQVALAAPSGGMFNIRVDVRGPRFSTYIQGQPVDIWTDNQLKAGGVGFLNDRGDRAEIKNVAISYLTGAGK